MRAGAATLDGQLGRAVGAARGALGHLLEAARAVRGPLLLGLLAVLRQRAGLVQGLHHKEHHERDDDELNDGVDEASVGDGGIARSQRQVQLQVREVHAAGERAHDRHDEVAHGRVDDGGERRADDHGHGQVHHVALIDEILEFLEKLFHGGPFVVDRDASSSEIHFSIECDPCANEKFMESLTGARRQPLAAAIGNPALGRVYYGAVQSRELLLPDDRRTS